MNREKVHLDNISSPGDLSRKRDQRNFFLLTAEETGVPCADVDFRQRNSTIPYLNPPQARVSCVCCTMKAEAARTQQPAMLHRISFVDFIINVFYYFINIECTINPQKLRYVIEKSL